jgi:hypothetical protein
MNPNLRAEGLAARRCAGRLGRLVSPAGAGTKSRHVAAFFHSGVVAPPAGHPLAGGAQGPS